MKQLAIFALLLVFSGALALANGPDEQTGSKDKPKLKSVSCDPQCGFKVRSHDENEIVSIVIEHSKKHHNKTVTEAEVKSVMKTEDSPDLGKTLEKSKEKMKEKSKEKMEEKSMEKPKM